MTAWLYEATIEIFGAILGVLAGVISVMWSYYKPLLQALISGLIVTVIVFALFALSGCQSLPHRYEVWRFDKHFRPYRVM